MSTLLIFFNLLTDTDDDSGENGERAGLDETIQIIRYELFDCLLLLPAIWLAVWLCEELSFTGEWGKSDKEIFSYALVYQRFYFLVETEFFDVVYESRAGHTGLPDTL